MSCHAMKHRVMPCDVMLCHVMPWHVNKQTTLNSNKQATNKEAGLTKIHSWPLRQLDVDLKHRSKTLLL